MARRGRPPHPDILTPREWDVLALLREGASNDEIASRLGITERTAKFHVSEILGKLGVASRDEAAAWQREDRRRWWAGALAPAGFVFRTAGGASRAAGVVIVGGLFATAIAGAVLLALLLVRSGDGSATASPALIAFSAGGSIYTVQPDGTGLHNVISGDRQSSWNAAPAFSPDGTHIAFTRDFDIWIADADGSNEHRLAAVAQLQTPPAGGAASNFSLGAQSLAWSPSGDHIAYVLGRIGGSGVQDLWVMLADGSDRRELSRSGGVWEQPVWLDNDRVSVVAPGKILVFNTSGAAKPAITFVDQTQQFSLAALLDEKGEWLVSPITAEGPITLGSADAGRKTVATGVGAALAPGGLAFAYFVGDTLHIAHTGGVAEEQVLDLAPLGGRDRFFGESYCVEHAAETCGYVLPQISWTGSAESTLAYLPALTYYGDALGISFKYPGAWVEGAADAPFRPCSACTILGPSDAAYPYGVRLTASAWAEDCGVPCYIISSIGRTQDGSERTVSVAGQTATQVDINAWPPAGASDHTAYHEKYTRLHVGDQSLVLVAFWRDGDTAAEQATRSGYDVMMKSLLIGETIR